jgi:uncharacterized protein (DUF2267 family)
MPERPPARGVREALQQDAGWTFRGAMISSRSPGDTSMNRNAFVRSVSQSLECDPGRAEAIALVVFRELRSRITVKEAADVAAQMPQPLRELWLDGEDPNRRVERLHREEFVGRVRRRAVLPDDAEAERAVKAVFRALQTALGSAHGTEGEAWDILSQLPRDLKALWMDAARS